MADGQEKKGEGLVKPYLGFLDTHVLFKKPVSCLFAIVHVLVPVYFLFMFIQYGLFSSGEGGLIAACLFLLAVLAFAGLFCALIWWHRRINRDEGPKPYNNFRRFIQTLGESLGTYVAIVVFGGVIFLMIFLHDTYYIVTGMIPIPVPPINLATAVYGPIIGIIIIIATKILLFLLDPLIWLVKQIWKLFVRFVLYVYRLLTSCAVTVEKSTPFWIGITWLLAIAAVIFSIILCFKQSGLFSSLALAFSLGFLGYYLFKRKHYDS